MNFDYTLYLVTDRQLMSCDSLTEAVEQAILGGCTMIQLREKELPSLEFYNQAVAVKQVTERYHIPLIINDRIDIAMAVQAAGVHIGQHDLPAATVRKVIGENMLLGVSASSIAEAIQAQQDGADYLGVGAMFPTGTKTDAESVSMEELQKIRTAVSLPIVVICGINKGNAGRFKPMGIDGLAVVYASDPYPFIPVFEQAPEVFYTRMGRSVPAQNPGSHSHRSMCVCLGSPVPPHQMEPTDGLCNLPANAH